MTEEKGDVLTVKNNKNPEIIEDKKENLNQEKNKEILANDNIEIFNSERINTIQKNLTNLQLELNKKDIIDLPQEIKTTLNISSCPICQSDTYSLYIPDSNSFSQLEKIQNNHEETPKVNAEIDEIKAKKYIYFPILICQKNHQRCLICNQNPHVDNLCEEQFLNYENIISIYDKIKTTVPEKKKNDFNLLYDFATTNISKAGRSCCSWNCTWSVSLLIFLWILWTAVSVGLFVVGIALLAVSLGLRVACCIYHCCYQVCCTTTVTEEDKGSYILRTTTHHRDKERADEIEQGEHDEVLSICGAGSLACAIFLIPEGYKKIWEWFKNWRD